MIEGVRKAREILASPVFDEIRGEEMAPGEHIQSDEEILDYLSIQQLRFIILSVLAKWASMKWQ